MRPSSATVRMMAPRMSRRTTGSKPELGSSSSSSSGRTRRDEQPGLGHFAARQSLDFRVVFQAELAAQFFRVSGIPLGSRAAV